MCDVLGILVEPGERADWLADNENIVEDGLNDDRVDVEGRDCHYAVIVISPRKVV
jgi:hypothetical protein